MKEVFDTEVRDRSSNASTVHQPVATPHSSQGDVNNAQMPLFVDEDVSMIEVTSWDPMRRALGEAESSVNSGSRHEGEHPENKPPEYSPSDTLAQAESNEPGAGGRETDRLETPATEEIGDTASNSISGILQKILRL